MAQLMEYTQYLAKEIGPRPAGTEEEQQAALYITEQFQKEAGFTSNIEEFEGSSNLEGGRAILAGVTIVVSILAMIFPVLAIPAFILAAAAAVVFVLEAYDRPIISRVLSRGASQNVIAKYQPNPEAETSGRARTRKIVLVAHYDTGRVLPGIVQTAQSSGLPFALIYVAAMVAAAVFALLRIFVATAGGGVLVILNVLTILALILCLLPIVKTILVRTAPYNEGANNNATGTAALIEIARRISRGSVSEADLANEDDGKVVIHGEQAAIESGLVPEGAQIRYEAEQIAPSVEFGTYDEEERLLAAKAAIAALTGKPVERRVYGSVADKLVNSRVQEGDGFEGEPLSSGEGQRASFGDRQEARSEVGVPTQMEPMPAASEPPVEEEASGEAEGFQNAPSWFIAAQKNAKRSVTDDAGEIHRSRYTEAMENAERGRIEKERAEQEQAVQAAEQERQANLQQARAEEAERAKIMASSLEEAQRSLGSMPAVEDIQPAAIVDDDLLLELGQRPRIRTQFSEAASSERAETAGQQAGAVLDARVVNADRAGESGTPTPYSEAELAGSVESPANPVDDIAEQEAQVVPVVADSVPQAASEEAESEAGIGNLPAISSEDEDDDISPALDSRIAKARHSIELPELDVPGGRSTRSRVSGLPSIDASSAGAHAAPPTSDPSRSGKLRNIRTSVPSLSGIIRTKNEARQNVASSLPSVVNVPTPVDAGEPTRVQVDATSMQSTQASVTVGEVDYDMEVPADLSQEYEEGSLGAPSSYDELDDQLLESSLDSDYAEESDFGYSSEYEAPAEPIEVELPKTRAGGFINRLRGKGSGDLDESPQEWLDVDEDFDARSVGRARGSWESFRNDSNDPFASDDDFGDFGSGDDAPRRKRTWEGGAYARKQLGHVNMRSGEDTDADEPVPVEPPEAEVGRDITGEIEQIYHFRNPAFNTEIWFVAVGSDTESHDGVKAFLEEHRSELRGSMVIEIESLGAGALSVASKEGALKRVSASSRIKRYTRDAVAATGIALDEVSLVGADSIASTVQKAGFQSMHLFGAENGRIALKGSADDVLENVDELLFDDNVNFIYELLKHQ